MSKQSKIKSFLLSLLCFSFLFGIAFTADIFAAPTENQLVIGQANSVTFTEDSNPTYFNFSVATPGILTVTYTTAESYYYAYLYTADRTETLKSTYIYKSDGVTKTENYALGVGTYSLMISGSSNSGTYTFTPTFTPVAVTEVEPNDLFLNAMPVAPAAPVLGFMPLGDKNDYYAIGITAPCKIQINMISYASITVKVTDAALNEVLNQNVRGTEKKPITSPIQLNVQPGTYYINVEQNYGECGKYQFSWDIKPTLITSIVFPTTKIIVAGTSAKLSPTIAPADATSKVLTYTSNNPTVISVDANGTIKAKAAGSATISAAATDGSAVTGQIVVIAKPAKPVGFKVKNKKHKMNVSWTKKANIGSYEIQYSKKKNFKGKKVKTVVGSKKSVKISSGKGTWFVRIRAKSMVQGKTYTGAWSKTVKVKIK